MNYSETPMLVLSLAFRACLSGWIFNRDRWLGLATGYLYLGAWWVGTPEALATAQAFAVGAALLVLVRGTYGAWGRRLVLASAVLMTGYVVLQHSKLDPFVHWPQPGPRAVGTFGNERYLGAFMAAVAPLAPLWLLPAFAVGLVASQSWLAVGAAILGVASQAPGRRKVAARDAWAPGRVGRPSRLRSWLIAGGGAVFLLVAYQRGLATYTLRSRWDAWTLGLQNLWGWPLVTGYGPAGWAGTIPQLQYPGEMFVQAHNEPLQWVYETGLIGLVLLCGWLWTNRAAIQGPLRGSLCAIGVLSCGLHVFHWPTLAPALLLIVGWALPARRPLAWLLFAR